MNERRHYHGGFVWPVILIGAGIVFLLNNLGMVSWNIWETLFRLWPVVLIAVGLDLLVGRRFPLGSALLAVLLIVVLALALQGALPQTVTASGNTVDRTVQVSEDLKGNEQASVNIGFRSGALSIGALSEGSPKLIEGSADLSKGESLNQDYSGSNGTGRFALQSQGGLTVGPEIVFGDSEKSWDLSLNRDIPLDLTVSTGAGKSTLDLTLLKLRRLNLDGGVGQVTVKLPAQGQYSAQVDGGVGQVVVMVPEGVAARIQTDGGLGAVSATGFRQEGDRYVTGDYNTAANRADVTVKGGVGQVVLKKLSE